MWCGSYMKANFDTTLDAITIGFYYYVKEITGIKLHMMSNGMPALSATSTHDICEPNTMQAIRA